MGWANKNAKNTRFHEFYAFSELSPEDFDWTNPRDFFLSEPERILHCKIAFPELTREDFELTREDFFTVKSRISPYFEEVFVM